MKFGEPMLMDAEILFIQRCPRKNYIIIIGTLTLFQNFIVNISILVFDFFFGIIVNN